MTNGIKADRALLRALAGAGLVDVAFHVDTTQQRKGFTSERELNTVRERYIDNARGLGLSVMFNTSVHGGNVHEVESLCCFFRRPGDVVRTASFQLQADTGRAPLRGRDERVSSDAIWRFIAKGAGTTLNTDAVQPGHRDCCSRCGLCLVIGERALDLLDDGTFVAELQRVSVGVHLNRGRPLRILGKGTRWLATHPRWIGPIIAWGLRKAQQALPALVAARGRANTLSFITHDFMHPCSLERSRITACVFKVMTSEGPISMCLHNTRRDEFTTQPVSLAHGALFDPMNGLRGPVAQSGNLRP
ncbi:MAG: hypothetical protein ACI8PT_002077 [Gammaproteobacteria bacterium]|jgi:hypothetical protein